MYTWWYDLENLQETRRGKVNFFMGDCHLSANLVNYYYYKIQKMNGHVLLEVKNDLIWTWELTKMHLVN